MSKGGEVTTIGQGRKGVAGRAFGGVEWWLIADARSRVRLHQGLGFVSVCGGVPHVSQTRSCHLPEWVTASPVVRAGYHIGKKTLAGSRVLAHLVLGREVLHIGEVVGGRSTRSRTLLCPEELLLFLCDAQLM